MTDKRAFNAHLNRKGLESSVSEEQARHMALHQGATYVFLVQAHAGPKVVNEDGSQVVSLVPDMVELVPEDKAELVRRFQAALYARRPDQFGQAPFEDVGGAEDPGDVAGELSAQLEEGGDLYGADDLDPDSQPLPEEEHTFVGGGDDPKRCALPGCGKTNRARVHVTSSHLSAVPDPEDTDDQGDDLAASDD